MDKIIFLDIDGVLAPYRTLNEYQYCCEHYINEPYGVLKFDAECVSNLNSLIVRSGAKIVVSSSWRCAVPIEHMGRMLEDQGVICEFLDYTPYSDDGRADEIKKWLSGKDIKHFVIIDDTPYEWGDLSAFWVQTNPHCGLNENDVKFAMSLFKNSL